MTSWLETQMPKRSSFSNFRLIIRFSGSSAMSGGRPGVRYYGKAQIVCVQEVTFKIGEHRRDPSSKLVLDTKFFAFRLCTSTEACASSQLRTSPRRSFSRERERERERERAHISFRRRCLIGGMWMRRKSRAWTAAVSHCESPGV